MKPLEIYSGRIHAPYFIFIEGGMVYSDEQVMRLLGIKGFVPSSNLAYPGRFLHITDDGRWLHVVDDWFYTQWHSRKIRLNIAKLASKHDIFTCSVGDSDHSFDFEYYKGGLLVRRYVVEDPKYLRGTVVVDFGSPLQGESAAFENLDELEKVLGVARSVGVIIDHKPEKTRSFTKPHPLSIRSTLSQFRRLIGKSN